jgi:pimeloyl-ACP methyl ester carboxylesterase
VHVGFSQGGLIAAQIATQAPPNTASLSTFGSPVSHLDLSGLRGVITAEHSEDLVPALSGFHATIGHDRHTILASAELGQQEQEMLPAHNMTRYTQTTERAELRGEAGLSREKVKIFAGFAGTGEASSWRSDRTPARQ